MFYVNTLQSKIKCLLYIGKTADLKRRIEIHNTGQNVSTKSHRPGVIVFYEAYLKTSDASSREKYFNTSQGHQALKQILGDYMQEYDKAHLEFQGSTA